MGRDKTVTMQHKTELPAEAFDRIPRAQVTFTDESVYLTRFDERGKPAVTYPAALADVAAAFNVLGARSGLLPADALFWERRGSRERIGIYLPQQVRALTFDLGKRKRTTLHVPLPGFVFVGDGARYAIYAVTERPSKESAALWVAPLPNVNPGGLICAGTVKFPACAADTIHAAAQLFFESGFNHDLSEDKFTDADDGVGDHSAQDEETATGDEHEDAMNEWYGGRFVRGRKRERTLFHFLKDLRGSKTFPHECLVPTHYTLKHLILGNFAAGVDHR